MKIKKIRIKSRKDFEHDLLEFAKEWDRGKRDFEPRRGEYFESLDAVRKMLTDKRLELWKIIRDQEPKSILELSKLAKRDFKGVHQDVNVLKAVGLISLKSEKGKRGDVLRPVSLADKLLVEVA